ncbi:MATE family efflux transporter [Natronospora cellulosivora (SeqCode)]
MKAKNNSEKLGTEAIIPLLMKLSIPAIVAMAIQALYNVVDSIYIGRYSTDALSALSLVFPIQIVLIAIAVGTGIGTSSYISRQLGRKNRENAANAAEHVLILTLIYGLVVGVAGYFISDKLLSILTNDPVLIELGTEYVRIILIGSLALFLPMIGKNILLGQGNTVLPMITMLIGAFINIALDPFLIFGIGPFPEMGVRGAAIATVFAQTLSGIFLLIILFSKKNEVQINFKNFKLDYSVVKQIYVVGLPAMAMQVLGSVTITGLNWVLGSYSATAVAAGGIYFRLQSFVFMPVFGLNQGYMPIMGYNFGHNKAKRMKEIFKSTTMVALCFTTAGFLLFQFFPEQLAVLFTNDQELIEITVIALRRISLAFPIIGPAIIIATTFQAIGKGMPSLILSTARQFLVLMPAVFYLSHHFGLDILWFAFPLSEAFSFVLGAIWLYFVLQKVFVKMEKKEEKKKLKVKHSPVK